MHFLRESRWQELKRASKTPTRRRRLPDEEKTRIARSLWTLMKRRCERELAHDLYWSTVASGSWSAIPTSLTLHEADGERRSKELFESSGH